MGNKKKKWQNKRAEKEFERQAFDTYNFSDLSDLVRKKKKGKLDES